MENKEKNLDILLNQNTNEQLSDFDWELFSESISEKLNNASKRKYSEVHYKAIFKIAASIAIAALIISTFSIINKTNIRRANDPKAVVTFPQVHGSAFVEILESNPKEKQSSEQSIIIIIRKQETEIESNQISRDELDFACLL